MRLSASRKEVDIVVEIGELPVERRRVGQHAEGVLIENALPVNDLQHDLAAGGLGEPPMHGRRARIKSVNMHLSDLGLDLIDCGATSKDIGNQLEIRDIRLVISF